MLVGVELDCEELLILVDAELDWVEDNVETELV